MAEFHFEGQQVTGQQQIAAGDIHNTGQSLTFGAVQSVQNATDLATLISQLQSAVTQAASDGTLPKKTGIATKAALDTTVIEIEEPVPDKHSLLHYLTTAKELLGDVAAATALVPGIVTAIEAVQKLF